MIARYEFSHMLSYFILMLQMNPREEQYLSNEYKLSTLSDKTCKSCRTTMDTNSLVGIQFRLILIHAGELASDIRSKQLLPFPLSFHWNPSVARTIQNIKDIWGRTFDIYLVGKLSRCCRDIGDKTCPWVILVEYCSVVWPFEEDRNRY